MTYNSLFTKADQLKATKHEDPKLLLIMSITAVTVAEIPPTAPTTIISHSAIRSHNGIVLNAMPNKKIINCENLQHDSKHFTKKTCINFFKLFDYSESLM